MAANRDISLVQGKTFSLVLRWERPPFVRKPISGITAPEGAARLAVAGHGLPDGWRVAVTGVKGPTEINAADPNNISAQEYRQITVIDANTIEFNDLNAADFRPYISGGFIQSYTPVDLTGFTARMAIKDKIGGTVLHSLTSENGGITIDQTRKTITLLISATDTALFDWKTGVYDLEMVSPASPAVVTALLSGKVSVSKEVTT